MKVPSNYVSLSHSSNPNYRRTKLANICMCIKANQTAQKCFLFGSFASVMLLKIVFLFFFSQGPKGDPGPVVCIFPRFMSLSKYVLIKVWKRSIRQRCPTFLDVHDLMCWRQQASHGRDASSVLFVCKTHPS